jgi:hypothetical protein
MHGNEKGTCYVNQTSGKVEEETLYKFQSVKKQCSTISQVAVGKKDTFKLLP